MTIKDGWQDKFINSLAKKGNATVAAKAAKITRRYAYEHRAENVEFAARWKQALEEAVELLEEEARRRAHDGVLKPVYQGGEKVGTIREFSDTLLIVLLKANKPQKYRDNARVEHTGPDGRAIEHNITDLRKLTSEQLIELHRAQIGDQTEDR